MKPLKLAGVIAAVVLMSTLGTDAVMGQSVAQRRQHPGTYHHRSRVVVVQPSSQNNNTYRSFSFEPGDTVERTTNNVFRPMIGSRSSISHSNHVGMIAHRRQHPGTN